jgi:glyoxylase-like metal-dependent hydrolase (beta-lactamase superfamily II)
MRIAEWLYLVGSGRSGFRLTDDFDSHVYLLDGGSEYALIDAGCGRRPEAIVERIEADGLDPRRISHIFITHGHADHAAGAAALHERLGAVVLASPEVARFLRDGDEHATSVDVARQAGIYPPDVRLPACSAARALADGEDVTVGSLRVEAVATPGHATGHLTYVVRPAGAEGVVPEGMSAGGTPAEGTVAAFTGDALFAGGKILLQHTWDCSVQESIRSVECLAAIDIDQLFPGHGVFALRDGRAEVEKAMHFIRRLLPPPQLG